MKRTVMLATAAALLATTGLAAPAMAATEATGTQQQMVVNRATEAVQTAGMHHQFAQLEQHAKGVFIVPSFKQGALVVGGSGGEGVLLVREQGTWSDPAFYSIGSISVGAQAGGQAGPVIMLLMTNKALHDFENANNFSLNGNAGLTIGQYSSNSHVGTNEDVIVWSQMQGASAGVSVSGSDITADNKLDQEYYGQAVQPSQILHGRINHLAANKLRAALSG